jgi:hypothetical protein
LLGIQDAPSHEFARSSIGFRLRFFAFASTTQFLTRWRAAASGIQPFHVQTSQLTELNK